jgi:hypothetical protein
MKNTHCRIWIVARKMTNVEDETNTMTWNMARNTEKPEN